METFDFDVHKSFSDYVKYERNITKFGWLIFLCLIIEDILVRSYISKPPLAEIIALQGILLFSSILVSIIRTLEYKKNADYNIKLINLIKLIEVVITVCLISTLYHSVFFYFVALLPVTLISLTRGFKKQYRILF